MDLIPPDFQADGVVASLDAFEKVAGKHFLLPRADVGRERLAEALKAAGAEVTDVVAYRALPADLDPERDPDLYRMLLDRQVDVVTFTSAASVRNFAATFGVEQSADLLQQTVVAVCGPVTAEAASRLGIPVSIMPTEYTLDALVDSIAAHYRRDCAIRRSRSYTGDGAMTHGDFSESASQINIRAIFASPCLCDSRSAIQMTGG